MPKRPLFRLVCGFVAFVFAVASPASGIDIVSGQNACTTYPTGLIAFLPGSPGAEEPGVLIANAATGEVSATIDTPPLDQITPIRVPGFALANDVDGGVWLVDAEAGTATRLDVPAELGTIFELRNGLPVGPGQRFTLIGDGRDAFLLDTELVTVTDIRPLLGPDAPPIPLFNTMLASDEAHVLSWDGQRLTLIPTATPENARHLSDGPSMNGSFSPDGRHVIYSRRSDADSPRELVVEVVEGSSDGEVIATGRYVYGVFVGSENVVAMNRDTGAEGDGPPMAQYAILDRSAGDERVLLEYEVNPVSLLPSPDGSHILFVLQGVDGTEYAMTDVDSGTLTAMPQATDLIAAGPIDGRFRLLYPATGVTDSAPAPGYYAVDLVEGSATILAPAEIGTAIVHTPPTFSADGTAAIGFVSSPDGFSMWHFDLEAATGTIVNDGPVAGLALSPDGCWLAFAPIEGEGAARTSVLRIQAPDGTVVSEIGQSRLIAWISS